MKDRVLTYGNLIEQWKVDLIAQRARHFGIPVQDWPDMQQSIILEVLKFKYNPQNTQGAEERTALTSMIDNRIIDLLRKQTSQDEHRQEYLHINGFTNPSEESLSYVQDNPFLCDFNAAIAGLSKKEQAVCAGLMQGHSVRQIAQNLRCRQGRVRYMIQNIRSVFSRLGVE